MEFHGEFHVGDLNGDSTVRDSEPPTTKNKGVGLKPSTIWGLTPKPLGGVGGISMIYHNLLVKHGRTMFPANISFNSADDICIWGMSEDGTTRNH